VLLTPTTIRRAGSVVAAALLAAALVGCGHESDVSEQPHIGGERFERVTFEGLPRPENGTQTSYQAKDNNQTEVIEINGTDVQNALDWYDQALSEQGWAKQTGPEDTRDGTLVTYSRLGRTVALVATKGKAAQPDQPAPTDVTVSFNNLALP
jgi:hypothetical protein